MIINTEELLREKMEMDERQAELRHYKVLCVHLQKEVDAMQMVLDQKKNLEKKVDKTQLSDEVKLELKQLFAENFDKLSEQITKNVISTTKEVQTSDEAARYLGISKSYIYKLTMMQAIPHYKPMGKMCYFNRLELEQWIQSNRVATADEIIQQAQAYCMKKPLRIKK